MKNVLTIVPLFVLFALFSCEKNDEIINPEWVDNWIAEIENDDYCTSCEINRYEYQQEYYYELFSPLFSCLPCQVHYADGKEIDSTFNVQRYVAGRKQKRLIYKKVED